MVFCSKEYDADPDEKVEKHNGLCCPIGEKQLQVVFCTKGTSELWIGYLPRKTEVVWGVREVMRERGLVEVDGTKVIFAERNRDVAFPL